MRMAARELRHHFFLNSWIKTTLYSKIEKNDSAMEPWWPLMIAESNPEEKEVMVKLVMNLLNLQ